MGFRAPVSVRRNRLKYVLSSSFGMANTPSSQLLEEALEGESGGLFDAVIDEYTEREGLSQDSARYLRRTVELIVQFEQSYRVYRFNESYTAADFERDIQPLGREAAELAAVGTLRGYGGHDAEALKHATAAVSFFERQLLSPGGVLDRIGSTDAEGVASPTINDFYADAAGARRLIEILSGRTLER